jgi:diphthamide biosynthesis enzyme Dph1/Dph2-like protein
MDKFEINSCIKWIEDNNFHIIALQLPDEDLDKVQDLIDILTSSIQNENIEFFLVGEGCSPCCNDLLNAQYCQAQGLIHFGHSCLGSSSSSSSSIDDNQQTISIFYVFYQQSLPYIFLINHLNLDIFFFLIREDVSKFLSTSNDNNKSYCLVFYDPCFRDAIEQYSTTSSHFIFSKINTTQNSIDPLDFSLYGRSVHLPIPLDPANYSIIFISYSKASLHNFALYFYAYDFR